MMPPKQRVLDSLDQASQTPRDVEQHVGLLRAEVLALRDLTLREDMDDETLFGASLQSWDDQLTPLPQEATLAKTTPSQTQTVQYYGLKPSPINLSHTSSGDDSTIDPEDFIALNDDFRITALLGEGGMGRVYSGVQTCLNREVALKVAKHDPTDRRVRAQVIHEAQVTAFLEHPHIMPVHLLAIEQSGQIIQVLKKVSGVSWHELLYQPDHPQWSELQAPEGQLAFHLDVLSRVCSALGYAHERGVIHRDIKPENVMVCRFGEVYVLDWGVALVLDELHRSVDETSFKAQVSYGFSELLVGTLAYMAPEMARREVKRYGPWCDVYLLGATLYEVLCGQRIRTGTSLQETLNQVVAGALPPIPDHLSAGFASLICDAISPHVEQRPQDATAFRERLLQARRGARAQEVIREAQDFTQELSGAIAEGASVDHLAALYDEARLSYRAGLTLGALKAPTLSELDALYSMWARHLITLGELKVAQQVLSSRDQPDVALNETLDAALEIRDQQRREHEELRAWSSQEAFARSRLLRCRLALLGLVLFGGGSLTLDLCERSGLFMLTSHDEFLSAASLSSALCLTFWGVMRWRKSHAYEQNAVFNRLWQYLLLTMVLLSIHRFISWQIGLTPDQLIHIEMPLIALSCFGSSSISQQRDFTLGGVTFFVMSIISVARQDLASLLYAIAMVILWSSVLITWRREPSHDRPERRSYDLS